MNYKNPYLTTQKILEMLSPIDNYEERKLKERDEEKSGITMKVNLLWKLGKCEHCGEVSEDVRSAILQILEKKRLLPEGL